MDAGSLGPAGPRGRAAVTALAVAVVLLAAVAGPAAAGKYVDVRAPAEATVGEPVTVTVVVEVPDVPGRNGSSDGTVTLAVDGERAHSRSVTATDGETIRVRFEHTFEAPGEYTLTGRAEATVEGTSYSDSDRTTIEVVERSGGDGGGENGDDGGDSGDDASDDNGGDGDEGGESDGSDSSGDDTADTSDARNGTSDAGGGSGDDADAGHPGRSNPFDGAAPQALAPAFDMAPLPGLGPVRTLTAHPLAVDVTGDGRVTLADALVLARAR